MRLARAAAVLLGLAAPVGLTAACGARSGLFLLGTFPSDAAVTEDALADVVVPPLDVNPPRDVIVQLACADASDTLIYNVTTDQAGGTYQLLKFNPSSAQFTTIGTLNCPDPRSPFSMAVDRQGHAYVLYYDYGSGLQGNLFLVDLNNASCQPTSYIPGSFGFASFGMGFVSNDVGLGETLFVASDELDGGQGRLGAINETTLALSLVGTFFPPVTEAELTGTGDGRLFAFWAPNTANNPGAAIAQIDKGTARILSQNPLPSVTQGGGWAFAFYGGQFYLFTAPNFITGNDPTTIVQRYDPATGSIVQVASYPQTIVGAGVSTCAPVQ